MGELVGNGDTLVGQVLKPFEVVDLLLDLPGLCGGHALAELFALMIALKDEIRPLGMVLAGLFPGVGLPAQTTAAEAVEGLELG